MRAKDLHPHDRGPKGTHDSAGLHKAGLPGLAIDGLVSTY